MPDTHAAELWTQLSFETEASPDLPLLRECIAPLIDALRDSLSTWHFFWEPDLWVRLRWRSEQHQSEGHAHIEASLASLSNWSFAPYAWAADAALMGEQMWPLCADHWRSGSELALARTAEHADAKTSEFYWARHVHTFSNQLVGTWADESRLCLRQARYRTWLLSRTRGNEAHRDALEASLAKLDELLADAPRLATRERDFVEAWRREGRPDIASRLDLPADFAQQRAAEGVADD